MGQKDSAVDQGRRAEALNAVDKEATLRAVDSSDDRLAADFFARTSSGLEAVYEAYGGALYSLARHILHDDDDAQDCVHDALLRAWEHPGTYRPERGALRSYLLGCVRYDALTRLRTAARHARIEESAARSAQVLYEMNGPDVIDAARLHEALGDLPPEQRETISLAYFQHLTHVEVAERLGLPLGTVKGRLRLALQKLGATLHRE